MEYKQKYIGLKTEYIALKNNMFGGYKKDLIRDDRDIKKFNVSEPWFSLIYLGIKTVEGRLNKGKFKELKDNDIIEWQNNDFNPRSAKTRVVYKTEYKTFREYLEKEGLDKCLPSIPTVDDGLEVYYKYYSKENEAEYGVIAIGLERV